MRCAGKGRVAKPLHRFLRRLLERQALVQGLQVVLHPGPFAVQKTLYRLCKRRVRQPVRAGGLHGQQGAGHLVFALGAPLKPHGAVGDAPLQRLLVAGLEMQAVHTLQGSPVAAIGHQSGAWFRA